MVILYFAGILIIDYLGYVQALHHLASYMLPEELAQMTRNYSSLSRRYIKEAVINPRMSVQAVIITKSFALIASSFLAVLISRELDIIYGLNQIIALAICLVAVWIFYLLFMEYLPGRQILMTVDKRRLRFVPFFAFLYIFLMPILRLYNRALHKIPAKISDEDKEEIIERAIESLAVQAGVNEPLVEEDEKEMIGQILQLDATEVREVMIPRINIIGLRKDSSFRNSSSRTSRGVSRGK